MEAHGVRKWNLKQIVITDAKPAQDVCQGIDLDWSQAVHRAEMTNAQKHQLKGPHRPKWNQGDKIVVPANNPVALLQFEREIVAEQA